MLVSLKHRAQAFAIVLIGALAAVNGAWRLG
jgi:hypothetical protein